MGDFDPVKALAAAAGGDQSAWGEIVGAYSNLVWSVVRGFRLSQADSADAYQGTWLRLVEHLDDIRDGTRLGSWLATTARREALGLLRRGGRDVPTDNVGLLDEIAAPGTLDESLLRDEEHRALWQAFGELSPTCQRLLRVVFADPPPPYEQISAALDMPIGSIGPTRARCLNTLSTVLTRSTSGDPGMSSR